MLALRSVRGITRKVLAGAHGRTLYLFEGDTRGTSQCSGACATAWPPFLAAAALKAGSGVNPALIGTIHRADGKVQVTYDGHPLYYFQGDMNSGTHHGEGVKAFGAQWYVVAADGSKIDES